MGSRFQQQQVECSNIEVLLLPLLVVVVALVQGWVYLWCRGPLLMLEVLGSARVFVCMWFWAVEGFVCVCVCVVSHFDTGTT